MLWKFGVYLLVHLEVHIPVVCGVYPAAHIEFHAALRQFSKCHERVCGSVLRDIENPDVAFQQGHQKFLGFFNRRTIFHVDCPVNATKSAFRKIVDGTVGQSAVRKDYHLIIYGDKFSAHDAHLAYSSFITLCLDIVSGLERLEGDDHYTAGKILYRAVQSHTDSHSTTCKQCCK